jgi:hypothetical protein
MPPRFAPSAPAPTFGHEQQLNPQPSEKSRSPQAPDSTAVFILEQDREWSRRTGLHVRTVERDQPREDRVPIRVTRRVGNYEPKLVDHTATHWFSLIRRSPQRSPSSKPSRSASIRTAARLP